MSAPAPRLLSYEEARERVFAALTPLPAQSVPLVHAMGRALRRAIEAPHALPPFRNSAMDGFAVRAQDLGSASREQPITLTVARALPAGSAVGAPLTSPVAVRIMTGAEVPEGADTVVPFEECERSPLGLEPEWARFSAAPRIGEHVRAAGADLAAGAVVFAEGRTLTPHDLALLGALGHAEIPVTARPRVAIMSTGDELLDVSAPLRPGAIRDTNLPMLGMLCEEAGAQVTVAERLPDDPARVATRIREALSAADVVLTIGGVSAGDHDPVKAALAQLDDIELWRVAMRPGRPQAFGRPHGRLFFGLPGNPASVTCVFEALVRPALRHLAGHREVGRPQVPVRMATEVISRAGRVDFVRASLEWRQGALWATPAGAQISGHLSPQAMANALVVVPADTERLALGDQAQAWVLRMPQAQSG